MLVFSGRNKCLISFLVFILGVYGAVSAQDQPDAGSIISSQQKRIKVYSEQAKVKIKVLDDSASSGEKVSGPRVKINSIHITGQNIYKEDILQNLVKDVLGSELTLAEMDGLASRITNYLHKQGYFVSAAYIPVQTIENSILEIRVVIGEYSVITLDNQSRLSNGVAARFLNNIKTGDYVRKDVLERTLLLLSDIGSINAQGTLVPGDKQGTTELIVEIKDAKQKTGEVSLNNYGNRYIGAAQVHTAVNIANVKGTGNSVRLGGTTDGSGFNDINLGYTFLIGSEGAKFEMGYYKMHYALGKEFASLNAGGSAQITTLSSAYPIIRSRSFNLYSHIGYVQKSFRDIHASSSVAIRNNQANVWNFGFSGNSQDKLGGAGANSFALNFFRGYINTNDPTTSVPGHYYKDVIEVSRWQYINKQFNFLLKFNGQVSSNKLDSTEKLFLGGADGIKAYGQGEVSGDNGYFLSEELRWVMPIPAYQLAVYYQHGDIAQNSGVGGGSITGAGLGLIYSGKEDYSLRLDYAWKLHCSFEDSNESNSRFWVVAAKYF